MKIIFDEGLETEREFEITNMNEHIMEKRLTANYNVTVSANTEFPDVSSLAANKSFETVKIVNKDNVEIALANDYNSIMNASANYYEDGAQYQINIIIGYKEEE